METNRIHQSVLAMFMKLRRLAGIPATPALLELSRRWRIKDLALQIHSRQVEPAGTGVLKAGYVESNLSLILVERPFRSGLLPELITLCTTSSVTESWL